MDWVFQNWKLDEVPQGGFGSALADEIVPTIGAVVAGRRWYDIVATARYGGIDGMYGGQWKGPVFVVTHRAPEGPHHPAVRFAADVPEAIAQAKRAAAGKNIALFGAVISRQCLAAGLVDDIASHLAPVLLGGGVRLFDAADAGPVWLERVSVAPAGRLTDLRFRPRP